MDGNLDGALESGLIDGLREGVVEGRAVLGSRMAGMAEGEMVF